MYIGPSKDFMFHLISGESAKLHPHPHPNCKQLTGIENHTDSKPYFWKFKQSVSTGKYTHAFNTIFLSHNGIFSTFPLWLV